MSAMDERDIERQVQEKGLTAPRIAAPDLDALIIREQYHVFPGTTMTVCALTLQNGFVVIGSSAAASPENFDAELGRQIAKAEARDHIWELEGYLLRDRLSHVADNKLPNPIPSPADG